MSFHWDNASSDDEEEEGLEALWTKAAQDQEDENDRDNEDDTDQDRDRDDGGLFAFDVAMGSVTTQSPSVARLPSGFENESEDEESVDWEDADHGTSHTKSIPVDDAGDGDQKLAANNSNGQTRQLQPVTIHIGKSAKDSTKKDSDKKDAKEQKTTTRRKYRFQSLPHNVQFLLEHLHKTHWLALTSHVMFHSSHLCSNELVLPVAHSLIPRCFWDSNNNTMNDNTEGAHSSKNEDQNDCVPSLDELRHFGQWYFDLIHNAETRRRQTLRGNAAAGAPRLTGAAVGGSRRTSPRKRKAMMDQESVENVSSTNIRDDQPSSTFQLLNYCSYLASSQSEDPQVWQQQQDAASSWSRSDQVSLFIAMTRSLGWRTRYVVAIEPMKKDLDMDHPMLQGTMVNVFQAAASWSRSKRGKKMRSRIKNEKQGSSIMDTPQTNSSVGRTSQIVGWVEVLCHVNEKKTRTAKQGNYPKPASMRWVHVDPTMQIMDEPARVEAYLFEQRQEPEANRKSTGKHRRLSKGASKKRHPVAFVMAAEHHTSDNSRPWGKITRKRLTDVTPRYAFSMVETLKLRGITPKQQSKVLSDPKGSWWSKAVKELNTSLKGVATTNKRSPSSKNDPPSQNKGNSVACAIDIMSDDDEKLSEKLNDESEEEDEDGFEKHELAASFKSEAIPTSKEKFKNHPLYVIPSVLKTTEVLPPDAKKRVKGFFKGEMVFSRTEVSEALTEKKWLYQGRKVKKSELKKPVKRVKARAKSTKGGNSFKALKSYGMGEENDGSAESEQKQLALASEPLSDGMNDLYATWQTDEYTLPYISPTSPIPVNEYKNIELALMNPGLVHIDSSGIAKVAKKLGIPYAPCLLGFEGHGGNRAPNIRGIVVHVHNEDLLREASVEVQSKNIEDENEKRRREIYTRWKKLLVGVLTKDRLEREYG